MLISVRHAFIFVATPNTASEMVENALGSFAEISRIGSAERRCIAWSDIRVEYSFLFDVEATKPNSFFKFGVIRDPVDWVWEFLRSSASSSCTQGNIERAEIGSDQLEYYWHANKASLARWDQSHMFSNFSRQCAMDHLIPFERLSIGLNDMFTRFNLPQATTLSLPEPGPGNADAPPQLKGLVEDFFPESVELYKKSVARFGSAELNAEPTVTVRALPFVVKSQLRDLEYATSAGSFTLAGVLLLDGYVGSDYELQVRGGAAPYAVQMGLPSPWLAKKFAGRPGSHTARFLIEGITLDETGRATIQIAIGDNIYNWIDIQ